MAFPQQRLRRTRRTAGLRVDVEADPYTIPGLVEAVTHLLAADPAKRGE